MRSTRLILLLACLAPLLTGCGRSQTVAHDDIAPDDAVARAQAPKDDKEDPAEKTGFRFPEDRGGVLLRKVLSPEVPRSALQERATAPRRTAPPPSLESPTLPLTPPVSL